ncbi:PatU [Thermoleptolyngbya sp.]
MQDRFYALLRHRLREEIERRPPLYPWETEVREYEDALAPELATATVWASQMQVLNLPVPMPEGVLNRLLEQCQSLLQSSLQEGRKLVQAVEALFPGESDALNHLAGYVMAAPARSGTTAPVLEGILDDYDGATQPQQMLLSLVAAREILNTLVLSISPAQPVLEREWHTTAGLLTLRAMLLESGSLRLVAQLPCAGRLKLQSSEVEKSAHRANAGPVSLELLEVEALHSYSVQVELEQTGTAPLSFAIAIGE